MARYLLQRPTGTNGLESLIHDYCPGLAFAHHDASEDAWVTGELFLAMLRHLEMPLGQLVETFALTQAPRQRGSLALVAVPGQFRPLANISLPRREYLLLNNRNR
ncbi:hypothetical protein NLL32_06225 [Corynebacterium propinquum]|nr:hypothetical protein [Corynebacterium propinquum]WKS48364.1 hypothetical protein NLL32_06225 [Corynebacterium propinquum]